MIWPILYDGSLVPSANAIIPSSLAPPYIVNPLDPEPPPITKSSAADRKLPVVLPILKGPLPQRNNSIVPPPALDLTLKSGYEDPWITFNVSVPSHSKEVSASNVLAVPEPVITLLFALLFIVVPVIPVNCEPSPRYDDAVTIPVNSAAPARLSPSLVTVSPIPGTLSSVSYTHLTLPTILLV